jgi:hypothetical protein
MTEGGGRQAPPRFARDDPQSLFRGLFYEPDGVLVKLQP